MTAKLVAEEGILKGLILSLEGGDRWIIGRDAEACELLIEDPSASRQHVLCQLTSEGIVAENLSQTNPALVNEMPFAQLCLLKNGDSLRIGSGLYRFYAESAAHVHDQTQPAQPENEENASSSPEDQEEIKNEHILEEEPPLPLVINPAREEETHDTIFDEDSAENEGMVAEINFDIADIGRWLLKVIGGPNNGAEFSMLSEKSYIIGTDPNVCDIIFHDNSVSRQHTRISIDTDHAIFIEDLNSRNGTLVDGQTLQGKQTLEANSLVSIGTSSFIVYDREGEMQTIISPLLPSIVKALQKEEIKEPSSIVEETKTSEEMPPEPIPEAVKETSQNALGAFILIAILTGLFIVVGIGVATLFRAEPLVTTTNADIDNLIKTALAPFTDIKSSFNKGTGRLLLIGHVITQAEKNQLLNNLQGLKFIKNLDDAGVIIDEYVWREINQVLARNIAWKGIAIHSQEAGKFVITGYLQTRKQDEQLWNYINTNFPYLDLLEKRIVVEEDVLTKASIALQNKGFKDVAAQISNGELTLSGIIPMGKEESLHSLIDDFRKSPGIRDVKNYVTEMAPEQSMINISDRYEVTGVSHQGANLSIVINGRILTRGDILDGMTLISIKPNVIFLEKDGVKYRIDYSR